MKDFWFGVGVGVAVVLTLEAITFIGWLARGLWADYFEHLEEADLGWQLRANLKRFPPRQNVWEGDEDEGA